MKWIRYYIEGLYYKATFILKVITVVCSNLQSSRPSIKYYARHAPIAPIFSFERQKCFNYAFLFISIVKIYCAEILRLWSEYFRLSADK